MTITYENNTCCLTGAESIFVGKDDNHWYVKVNYSRTSFTIAQFKYQNDACKVGQKIADDHGLMYYQASSGNVLEDLELELPKDLQELLDQSIYMQKSICEAGEEPFIDAVKVAYVVLIQQFMGDQNGQGACDLLLKDWYCKQRQGSKKENVPIT